MILNSTHENKEHKQLLVDLIDKPFSFLESIRMKGIRSKRLSIKEVSPNLKPYMNFVSDINYVNIELRKKGVLIYFNKGLQNFTWVIPYYQLVVYKTNGSSIHAQGKFIHFENNKIFKENKNFFDKMLDEKVKYDMQYNFQPV